MRPTSRCSDRGVALFGSASDLFLLVILISATFIDSSNGSSRLLQRRATVQQARCVSACLGEIKVTGTQSVEQVCNANQTCIMCTAFCLEDGTRFRLTDQTTCLGECGTAAFCTVACSFFSSSDMPRDALQRSPHTRWNITGQRISMTWQTPFQIATDTYLVCISSSVPCDSTFTSMVYLLAIGEFSAEVPANSASLGQQVHIAQVSAAGTSGFSPASVLLPGPVSDIMVSKTFYSALDRRTFVNISWSSDEDDGYTAARQYSVVVEHEDTSIPRGNDACTRYIRRHTITDFVIIEMLGGGLDFDCDYDIMITPMLPNGEAVNGSTTILEDHYIRGNVRPPPDESKRLCLFYNIRHDLNVTISAGPVGSRGISIKWGWWSFNQTLPVYDFVSSLGQFTVGLFDLSYSQAAPRVLIPSLDPIRVDSENSLTTDINVDITAGNTYIAYVTFHLFTSDPVPQTGRYQDVCTSPNTILQTAVEEPPRTTSTVSTLTRPDTGETTPGVAEKGSESLLITVVVPAVASLAVILIIAIVACVHCNKQQKLSPNHMSPVSNGTLVSMAISDITASTDIGNSSIALDGPSDIVRPIPDIWEVPRKSVHLLDQLGRGAFGQVIRAQLDNPPRLGVDRCEVAVKKLFDTANSYDKSDLLDEISRMKDIASAGGHRHLVRFVACCTQDDPIYLMSECIAHGSLKDLLQRTRQAIPNDPTLSGLEAQGKPRIALADGQIHPAEACDFARQIAEGMAFLTHMRMIHRDLATRNILVDRGKVLKVSDFGMTRDVYEDPDEVYIKTTGGKVPIRWMSIEALTLRTYSSESDMWAFGVVLWEIATLAKFPYSGIQNRELISELRGGMRMEKPRGCPDETYEIMLQCWNEDPDRRPRFSELVTVFEDLPQKLDLKKKSRRPSLRSLRRPYAFPRITANLKTGKMQAPQAPAAPAPIRPGQSSVQQSSPVPTRVNTNFQPNTVEAI
ncbi:uncharacterized protein LOC135804483 [Sycon ciliatum]|uniref:uncharacterized protein LOC135804483 n=1 Tax=Sycon ciliatum TaxID=27933 RepID=UPI0031F5FF07